MARIKIENLPGPDTFCFTFGQTHTHPETGEPMKNYWIEVTAKDGNSARAWMFENYGPKWAFMYRKSKFDATWYRAGCYESVNILGEENGEQS